MGENQAQGAKVEVGEAFKVTLGDDACRFEIYGNRVEFHMAEVYGWFEVFAAGTSEVFYDGNFSRLVNRQAGGLRIVLSPRSNLRVLSNFMEYLNAFLKAKLGNEVIQFNVCVQVHGLRLFVGSADAKWGSYFVDVVMGDDDKPHGYTYFDKGEAYGTGIIYSNQNALQDNLTNVLQVCDSELRLYWLTLRASKK